MKRSGAGLLDQLGSRQESAEPDDVKISFGSSGFSDIDKGRFTSYYDDELVV